MDGDSQIVDRIFLIVYETFNAGLSQSFFFFAFSCEILNDTLAHRRDNVDSHRKNVSAAAMVVMKHGRHEARLKVTTIMSQLHVDIVSCISYVFVFY